MPGKDCQLSGGVAAQQIVVELWRVSGDRITFVGSFAHVPEARAAIPSGGLSSWFLSAPDGRQYLRLETGCN